MDLEKIRREGSFLLERYQELVDTPVVEDFTQPRWTAPYFNLLAWLRVANLYLAVNAVDAVNGQWEQGVSNILSHIAFARRVVKGSRTLLTSGIGKSVANTSLKLLALLMNRDDCPQQVFKQIMAGLPPLKPGDLGSGNNLIYEYLTFVHYINEGLDQENREKDFGLKRLGSALFLQENRTLGYMNRYIKKIKHLDETPPYRWEADLKLRKIVKAPGVFSWLVNPVGKSIFYSYRYNYAYILRRAHRTRALYDLVRISAELHLEDNPGEPAAEVLKRLDTYKAIDLCSGQPYKWNPQKQVLYSIGTDRRDNGGVMDWKTMSIDVVLPVRLSGRK